MTVINPASVEHQFQNLFQATSDAPWSEDQPVCATMFIPQMEVLICKDTEQIATLVKRAKEDILQSLHDQLWNFTKCGLGNYAVRDLHWDCQLDPVRQAYKITLGTTIVPFAIVKHKMDTSGLDLMPTFRTPPQPTKTSRPPLQLEVARSIIIDEGDEPE